MEIRKLRNKRWKLTIETNDARRGSTGWVAGQSVRAHIGATARVISLLPASVSQVSIFFFLSRPTHSCMPTMVTCMDQIGNQDHFQGVKSPPRPLSPLRAAYSSPLPLSPYSGGLVGQSGWKRGGRNSFVYIGLGLELG
jgi:hypothetical protein